MSKHILVRAFTATGRESSSSVESDLWNDYTPKTGAVTASACQAYTRNYAYDKMGNIDTLIQTGTSGFTRNFTYNDSGSNILHAVKNADESTTHASFTYDVNGNRLTSGSAKHYVWDYGDQLKSFYNQTGTNEPSTYAQYLYSGGQRVKKLVRSSGGDTETTVYIDGIMEFRADSSAHTQSVVHIGGVVTIRTGYAFDGMASITYELSNHLGSSSYRLGSTGLLLDREEYYPFGDTSLRTWEKKRYRYVGKEKDQESGLYYYGARYYAAWTCRFISTDPLARDYPHLTSYNYASNAPINHLDVDGMQSDGDETIPDAGPSKHAKGNYNAETGIYTVVNGDWLSAIALRFGLTPDDVSGIAGLNGIDDPDEIKAGDTILIPIKVPDDVLPSDSEADTGEDKASEINSLIESIEADIFTLRRVESIFTAQGLTRKRSQFLRQYSGFDQNWDDDATRFKSQLDELTSQAEPDLEGLKSLYGESHYESQLARKDIEVILTTQELKAQVKNLKTQMDAAAKLSFYHYWLTKYTKGLDRKTELVVQLRKDTKAAVLQIESTEHLVELQNLERFGFLESLGKMYEDAEQLYGFRHYFPDREKDPVIIEAKKLMTILARYNVKG